MLGEKLVRSERVIPVRCARAALMALCLLVLVPTGCKDSRKIVKAAKERRALANVPRVTATVLSYHVDLFPKKLGFDYLISIAPDGKARIGDEADQWRLIDIPNRSVTFVNTADGSFRTLSLPQLVAERRRIVSGALPAGVPRATVTKPGPPEMRSKWEARRMTIAVGPYRRDLWTSTKSLTPEPLFALILLSEPLSAPFAGMLRDTLPLFENARGMPVVDRSEMVWDGRKLIIQRVLQSVATRSVPAAWFQIPQGYRNLTPSIKGSSGSRPGASSRPAGQSTPAVE